MICYNNKTSYLESNLFYCLQHGVKMVNAKIEYVDSRLDINQMGAPEKAEKLDLNDLGQVKIKLAQPIYFDDFDENKESGAFILIDMKSHATAGVGFFNQNSISVG